MSEVNYSQLSPTMPLQKVSWQAKQNKEFQQQSVDAVISMCNTFSSYRRSPIQIKRRNYNLLNNKIDKADFEYVLNPFNLSKDVLNRFQYPANLQPYDVVSPLFMLLFGEESKRIFSPIVRAVNEDSINTKSKQRKEAILQTLQQFLISQLQNPEQEPDLSELEKYSRYSEKDMTEKVAEDILTYYRKHLKLDNIFQNGWKDSLIAAEEIYCVEEIAGHPQVRRVNPLEISYLLPNNTDFIDDASMIYERNRKTLNELVDEFYDILEPGQIDDLEQLKAGRSTFYNYFGGPNIQDYFGLTPNTIPVVSSIYNFQDYSGEKGIEIHRVKWQSYKKVGTLTYFDEKQEAQEILVDEFYKADKELGEHVDWFWINEWWEGIRIGQDMYLKIQPCKHQHRSIDNLSKSKSGYVGSLYNSLNSQAVSLMDRIYPWVSLYFILWYRTELLIARNVGNLALIDTSLIPDGMEMEKWMYYAQAMGFGFVNSYNAGAEGERRGKFNASNQNKTLDLDTSKEVISMITLLQTIESKIKQTAGITDQRLGEISASELVGNTERAVVQSSNITEEWFRIHDLNKVRVCELLIEVAKECIGEDSKAFQYVTDDMATVLFEVNGTELLNTDMGVFVENSQKAQEALNTYKKLLEVALQNDKVALSDVASVLTSESIAAIKNTMLAAEDKRMEQGQQMEQQQQQMEQQRHQEMMDLENQKLELDRYKIDEDNRVKLEVATMQSLAIDEGSSPEAIFDTGEIALKQQELASKQFTEQQKILHDKTTKEQELKLKKEELDNKRKLEELKIKQTQVQNTSQEKIEKQKLIDNERDRQHQLRLEKIKGANAIRVQKAKPKPKSPSKKK